MEVENEKGARWARLGPTHSFLPCLVYYAVTGEEVRSSDPLAAYGFLFFLIRCAAIFSFYSHLRISKYKISYKPQRVHSCIMSVESRMIRAKRVCTL